MRQREALVRGDNVRQGRSGLGGQCSQMTWDFGGKGRRSQGGHSVLLVELGRRKSWRSQLAHLDHGELKAL